MIIELEEEQGQQQSQIEIQHTKMTMEERLAQNAKRVRMDLIEEARDVVPSNALKGPDSQNRYTLEQR